MLVFDNVKNKKHINDIMNFNSMDVLHPKKDSILIITI